MKRLIKYCHSIYRLVIRNIQGYGTFQILPKGTKRAIDVSPTLDALKAKVLGHLLQKQSKRKAKLINWSIAWEIHPNSGLPHLDILIVFQKNITPVYTSFDYLITDLKIQQRYTDDQISHGHVWVTPYSPKKLNKAILDYGFKEDPSVITNLTSQRKQQLIQVNLLKADPYRYLELQMLKDPLHFNFEQYVRKNDLAQYVSSWSSIKTKLKDMQLAAANLKLKQKPGFKYIDNALAKRLLTTRVYRDFTRNKHFLQLIVQKLNEIVTKGFDRVFKSKQLLIVSPPDTGKTSLALEIQKHVSVYYMGVDNWWPSYRSYTYPLILWDQFNLKSMPYDLLLKFLQGLKVDLQYKGGSVLKTDNQLIYMTSNMTLQQHICSRFKDQQKRQLARANLRARIDQVILPEGANLFLLQKLIVSA